MQLSDPGQSRLAVLIDADNAHPAITEGLLAEIAKYGIASVKRIYGDWTTPQLTGWKTVLLEHSIQPIQQFRYTVGKNATDSAMIIDAMDLLYTGRFDGFCLVSSDSDFTRLAARIRESGLRVIGFGEEKTPKPFVSACDKFVYTEVLVAEVDAAVEIRRQPATELKRNGRLVTMMRNAIDAGSDEDGWAQLGSVGSNMQQQMPDFDPRNFGYKKLSDFVNAFGLFEIDARMQQDGRSRDVYVRDKRKRG
jgi:uncharacterized LabA/DUF88 family protein